MVKEEAIHTQIQEFVEHAPIEVEEQFQSQVFLGYKIRSLVDPDLSCIAWLHSNLDLGIQELKKNFVEKLQKDYIDGKPLPFKLKKS